MIVPCLGSSGSGEFSMTFLLSSFPSSKLEFYTRNIISCFCRGKYPQLSHHRWAHLTWSWPHTFAWCIMSHHSAVSYSSYELSVYCRWYEIHIPTNFNYFKLFKYEHLWNIILCLGMFCSFTFVPLYPLLIPLTFWYLACPEHILQRNQWLYD